MIKHWNLNTMVITERGFWTEGYCKLCGSDMSLCKNELNHYNSHSNAKKAGMNWKFIKSQNYKVTN